MPDIVHLYATATASASGQVTARLKHSFSRQHMFAAEHFAASARTIEDSGRSANQEDLNKHRACATAAVLSAVAFLESSINEFYHEAQNRDTNSLGPLKENVLALLDQFWPELERSSVLHKYQLALLIAGTHRFDQGGQPYQDADSLIKLRDGTFGGLSRYRLLERPRRLTSA